MSILDIIIILLLLPIGAFLREAAYRSVRDPNFISRSLSSLFDAVVGWMRQRKERQELRRKYKHLNKKR